MSKKMNKILVVDDDEVNNFILKELFQEAEIADQIVIESSVDSALSYLAEEQSLPQLILLDINMPIKDGFDFLEEYHEMGFDQKPCKIILLTSSLFEKDRAAVVKYENVIDFIIKPIDLAKLKNLVQSIPSA